MPDPPCPICDAPLPLVLDAQDGRCPSCGFDFGRVLRGFRFASSGNPGSLPADYDSLETVEVVMQWEEHCDSPPLEELDALETIGDVILLTRKHRRPPGQ